MHAIQRVVYIAGYGRSGSTLLASLLGSVPGVFAAGELSYVWTRILGDDKLCSCGQPFSRCPLWTRAVALAFGNRASSIAERMQNHKRTVDRLRFVPSSAAAHLPQLAQTLAEYASVYDTLLGAVSSVTGCDTIVDATKVPSYLAMLRYLRDRQPVIVHLVRDPRGVAFSQLRAKDRPEIHWARRRTDVHRPARTAGAWCLANLGTLRFRREHSTVVHTKYEHLVSHPRRELDRILGRCGLPSSPGLIVGNQATLAPGHMFAGNSSRLRSGLVELRPDVAWHDALPSRARRVVQSLTWPLLLRFGYPVTTSGEQNQ